MANLIMAGAALGVASVMLIMIQFVALRSAMVDDLQVQARIVGGNSSAALLFQDRKAGSEILAALAVSPNVRSAGIIDRGGQLLAWYRRDGASAPPAPPAQRDQALYHYTLDHVEVVEPVFANGARIGSVQIFATMTQLYQRLIMYAVFTLAVAMCSFVLAHLLVRRMREKVRLAEAHLHYLAHVDVVTTLPNRNEFNARLAVALERAARQGSWVGLLLLDLDNFKVVNDTLGHNAGDALLKLVAQRLSNNLRTNDVIFRIGGDEFVVTVEPAFDAIELEGVARRLMAALDLPFEVDGHQLYVTASIGISSFPRDARDSDTLTRSADTAMYQAKSLGKNAFALFQPEMDLRAQKRLRLEAHLRNAIGSDELRLHYQPQIDMASGRIVGLEALARWTSAELGVVSPGEFIPVAEESGVIIPLGRWVLQTACRQIAAWRDAGLLEAVEHVSINVSACQTREGSLMGDIADILAETNLPPGLLELEITESVLMCNVQANLELMQRLQDAGIYLSIDDFGTGYSSMAYLRRFPIGQIKIDRSFIIDVPGSGEAIVAAIIALAHSLHMTVVAEGAETARQVEFLRNAGCDMIQGYYFSRPLAAEQVTALLRERRRWELPGVVLTGT
ncbi:MAG: EAL domain-containing protein [Pseudomonadota bacterium]|nr:EAL domain-containing protein [Pseudomonadota bacterium]